LTGGPRSGPTPGTRTSWTIATPWTAGWRAIANAIAGSNAIVAELDLASRYARDDIIERNVRYVLYHMIEETARHAGHADIIRETIDGTTGF